MATRWLAITTGQVVWNSTASWSATDGGATGASIPVTGDTVQIPRGFIQIPGQDLSAVVLAAMYVSAAVSFGSSGVPFSIGFANPASAAIVCSFAGDYGDTYFAPVCAGTNCVVQFTGNGNVWLSNATAQGTFICAGGSVRFASTFTNSTVGNWSIVQMGGTVAVDAGTANAVNVDVQDGEMQSARSINTGTVSGRLFLTAQAAMAALTVFPAAFYCHQSTGTITMLTGKTGSILSDSGAIGPFTVTNATVYGTSQLFTRGNPLITYTNQPQMYTGGNLATI